MIYYELEVIGLSLSGDLNTGTDGPVTSGLIAEYLNTHDLLACKLQLDEIGDSSENSAKLRLSSSTNKATAVTEEQHTKLFFTVGYT